MKRRGRVGKKALSTSKLAAAKEVGASLTWGLGLEHEFLPAERGREDTWKAMRVSEMVSMKTKSEGTPDGGDQAVEARLWTASVGLLLAQPVSNPRPPVAPSSSRRPLNYDDMDVDITVFLRDGELSVSGTADHGWDVGPCTVALEGVKVRVYCRLFTKRISVYVLQDETCGAVYDFSRLRDDVEIASRHVYERTDEGAEKSVPEEYSLDSGFVEVRSDRFSDATVASVVKEVRDRERTVLDECAPYLSGLPEILPHAMVLGNDVPTYAGSYHVWVTLPHRKGPRFDHARFVADHSRAIVALQWVEPLLLGCMCPDPRAPGEGLKYSRASMRSDLNYLSGVGIARMAPSEPRVLFVYDSLEALNAGRPPSLRRLTAVLQAMESGETINILDCQEQGREALNDFGLVPWQFLSSVPVAREGTDLRFNTCQGVNLRKGRTAIFMDGDVARLASHSSEDSAYTPATGGDFQPAGFEFRLFDHFPSEHAANLVAAVVTLSGLTHNEAASLTGPVSDSAPWIQQVGNAAMFGSRGPVHARYWTLMRKGLGLDPAAPLPSTMFDALNVTLRDAYEACGRNAASRRVIASFGVDAPPAIPDSNFEIWKASAMAKMSAKQLKLLSTAARAPTNARIQKVLGPGWLPDVYALRSAFPGTAAEI
jgi:hypothetical protein